MTTLPSPPRHISFTWTPTPSPYITSYFDVPKYQVWFFLMTFRHHSAKEDPKWSTWQSCHFELYLVSESYGFNFWLVITRKISPEKPLLSLRMDKGIVFFYFHWKSSFFTTYGQKSSEWVKMLFFSEAIFPLTSDFEWVGSV